MTLAVYAGLTDGAREVAVDKLLNAGVRRVGLADQRAHRAAFRTASRTPRMRQAMNEHDLGAFVACFDPGYRSEQPAHPNRGFGGREQVEKNWSALFGGIPDFHAELLTTAAAGGTVCSEWHWTGTRENQAPFEMRGVTVFVIRNGRIVAGRLYMEEVEEAGADIDETVRRLAAGTQSEPGKS